MLGRSRLQEFYQRVLREDMLTLFNHTASLNSLECSVVLHGAATMNDETRYRAAAVLEILTGQRVASAECDAMVEDPQQRTASESQRRDLETARGAYIQQSMLKSKKKNAPKVDSAKLAQEIRKLGTSIKLKTHLHNVKMYYFLEKCREFYLPDIVTGGGEEGEKEGASWRPDIRGHENDLPARGIVLQYEKFGGSKRSCYPERYPVRRAENPQTALSCYTLRSTDLLKFPDIEVNFEALGSVLGGKGGDSNANALQLILRPSVKVMSPLDRKSLKQVPEVENLRIMNYLLSQYFNGYLQRPHIGGLI